MAGTRARPRPGTFHHNRLFFEFGFRNERKPRLRIVGTKAATAHSIFLETTAYFAAPLRFGLGLVQGTILSVMMNCTDGDGFYAVLFDKRAIAKRTSMGVLEQQGTTVRAYLYHWSVLRCGSSSEERQNGSTNPNERVLHLRAIF
jgi:hypothetical protein